jgi:hypothetical protein
MAHLTISDAPSLTGSASASGDLFPVVDVSASEGSKGHKITRDELGDAMLRTAAVIAALGGKAATSHSHSAATTIAAGFMSSTDKTKLDGLSNPVTPGVIYVTTEGNDTTGNGSFNKPYASLDKALEVGAALSGSPAFTVCVGAGSFGCNYALTHTWPNVVIAGAGETVTVVSIFAAESMTLRCAPNSASISLIATGAAGTVGSIGTIGTNGGIGGPGGDGENGPNIVLIDCCGALAKSQGGAGGAGGTGAANVEGGDGSQGGDGGPGGTGGTITLINSRFNEVRSLGGEGGAPGEGGAGATGTGASGNAGLAGVKNDVELFGSHVTTLECDNLKWGRSNVEDSTEAEDTSSYDYGGNSTMSYPTV